jgi:hypothetical protein
MLLRRRVLEVLLPGSLLKRACGWALLLQLAYPAVLLSKVLSLLLHAVHVACSCSV